MTLDLFNSRLNLIHKFGSERSMAENNAGSQESLPLSQETYLQLFRELDGSLNNIMQFESLRTIENWDSFEVPNQHIPILGNPPDRTRPVSSLPASENWPGDYSFSISFSPQKTTKGISWIFSKERNKLYVGKNVHCPVNFSASGLMSNDVYIRAMALFSSSDHASERVTRCVNHSMDELDRGVFEAEHLIRCDAKSVNYENDPITGRHSVIVPFENPAVGQEYSTYLYKFMCFGSCSGGPNRRALMIVFTLERRGEVIGRQSIDLKVCACPSRDYKADEKETQIGVLKEKKPVKRPVTDQLLTKPSVKKLKQQENDDFYFVKTRDRQCYTFLKKMKRLYDIHAAMHSTFPSLRRLIYTSSQSSSGEDTEA